MEKHTVLSVRKCLHGNVGNTFSEYFDFDLSNKSARNNDVLLNVMTKTGFFFMGKKYYNSLPLDIQRSQFDFRDKVSSYVKNKQQSYFISFCQC